MAHVFRSGAFLQQCFSVHPLSLNVKKFTPPDTIGIACVHCTSRHRLTIDSVTRLIGTSDVGEEDAATELASCVANHHDALHVTDVRVERNLVQFRCRVCKTGFHATATLVETYQP